VPDIMLVGVKDCTPGKESPEGTDILPEEID
jgi:hypothetical protein